MTWTPAEAIVDVADTDAKPVPPGEATTRRETPTVPGPARSELTSSRVLAPARTWMIEELPPGAAIGTRAA